MGPRYSGWRRAFALCSNILVRLISIDSLDDPRVGDYRNVKDPELRHERGLFIAEGRMGVRGLIEDSPFRTRSLFVTPTALSSLRPSFEAMDANTPIFVAAQPTLNGVVGYDMHRGCLAAGERGSPIPFRDLLAPAAARSLGVVIEQLSNPDNVGGIFRNALAFGADWVLLCPRSSDPLYRKSIRVSMSATLRVPFSRCTRWPEPLRALREAGYRLVALHPGVESTRIEDFGRKVEAPSRVALLLGNEGQGLSSAALALADWQVRIPLRPGVDSLNVATASGIALHHFSKPAEQA